MRAEDDVGYDVALRAIVAKWRFECTKWPVTTRTAVAARVSPQLAYGAYLGWSQRPVREPCLQLTHNLGEFANQPLLRRLPLWSIGTRHALGERLLR